MTERLGELFNQQELPLSYAPRKILHVAEDQPALVSIEAEHRTRRVSEAEKTESMDVESTAATGGGEDEDEEEANWEYEQKIVPPSGDVGSWSSCIRLFDPTEVCP